MNFITVIKIILYGIIEGIAEWLPISSTGHLILFDNFIQIPFSPAFMNMFEYVIQLAAICAVILLFFKRLFPLGITKKNNKNTLCFKQDSLSIWGKVVVACFPALLAFFIDVFLLKNIGETMEVILIALTLIIYGVAFILLENYNKKRSPMVTEISGLSLKTAFLIGCFQVLAVIPGTSRSGITILSALLLSVNRTTAAEFTFFLAIPTTIGASGYKILTFLLEGNTLVANEWIALLIGCVVAFSVSLFAIRFLMDFVKKHDFKVFGWYRIILGVVVICALVLPTLL